MKKRIAAFPLFLLLSACIQDLDIEMPSAEGMIALNGFIKNGENGFSLHLSESIAFTNTNRPPTITEAEVEFRINGSDWQYAGLCDTSLNEPANHYCVQNSINTGDIFQIRAFYKEQSAISASARVPEMPEVKDTLFTDLSLNFLLFQPDGEHYYIIDIINYETAYDDNFNKVILIQQNQLTTSNPTLELLGSSNDLIDLPIDESYGLMAFVKSSSVPVAWRPIDLRYYQPGQAPFYLRIRKCSKSYYEYHRTKILNRKSNDNPFVQPVNYHSNVKNGLGVLGAYSEKLIKLNS